MVRVFPLHPDRCPLGADERPLSATRTGDFRAKMAACDAGPGRAEGAAIMERQKLNSSLWISAAVIGLALDLSGCSREASASSLPTEPLVSVPITQVTSRST